MTDKPKTPKEEAKNRAILDVAESLGMDMKKSSSRGEYFWKEHDSFKINTVRNTWSWYSKSEQIKGSDGKFHDKYRNQDTIRLVEEIKGISFKEAMTHILGTEAGTFDPSKIPKKQPYIYRVRETRVFEAARKFLKETRGLSDETIDFFRNQGILVQGIHTRKDGKTEPVVVFKHLDWSGKVIGATKQGIWEDKKKYPKGAHRLKKVEYGSNRAIIAHVGNKADHIKNATPEHPFKLYTFEAPLDMMSYYELHKEQLSNACLVACNGFDKSVVSQAFFNSLINSPEQYQNIIKSMGAQKVSPETYLDHMDAHLERAKIILCLDNDEAGQNFFWNFEAEKLNVEPHFPPLHNGQSKNDWNQELQILKGKEQVTTQEVARENTALKITSAKKVEQSFEMSL